MNIVLILYPEKFQSQSKFERKVGNIIGNLQDYCIVFPSDPNKFIIDYFNLKSVISNTKEISEWETAGLTHAIIFDDGEEFISETKIIEDLGIPLRRIKISITRVVNIKKETQFTGVKRNAKYEYIGRGSYWGNPYSMFAEGDSRDEVIRKFKYDFDNEKFAKKDISEVYKLVGKRLGCFCKPDTCHGDVLADFLNKWDDGE
jgi:hypothetical protein